MKNQGRLLSFNPFFESPVSLKKTVQKLFFIVFVMVSIIASGSLHAQCTGPGGDCDGDGIINSLDTDNDNDGITDSVENGQGTMQWTAAQLSAFSATPFTAAIGCGTNMGFAVAASPGLSAFASSTVNYNTLLSTDMGVPLTLPRSMSYTSTAPGGVYGLQGTITVTVTPGTLYQLNLYFGDPEGTSYTVSAYDAADNLIATTDWSVAKYRTTGLASTAMGAAVVNATNATYTANNASLGNDAFRVRFGESTLLQAVRIVIENYRYAGTGTGGDGLWFFAAGICRPNTDADATPDYQDTDSDNDGCPDALEGGASFTYSQLDANSRLSSSVDAGGIPVITGSPQARGTSYNNSLFDAQSACEFPDTYNVTVSQPGMPSLLNLGTNPLQGSDGIDLPAPGSWTGRSVAVTTLPGNDFILRYNGAVVTTGQVITPYNPSLLTVAPGPGTPNGTLSASFEYATIDAAQQQDPSASTYTINWSIALPVTLQDFSVTATAACSHQLSWTSGTETAFLAYILEWSADGLRFTAVDTIHAQGSNKTYRSTQNITNAQAYFRLKMADLDGKISYSKTIVLRNQCMVSNKMTITPNPGNGIITVNGLNTQGKLQLADMWGRVIFTRNTGNGSTEQFNMSAMPPGIYLLHFAGKNGLEMTQKIIRE